MLIEWQLANRTRKKRKEILWRCLVHPRKDQKQKLVIVNRLPRRFKASIAAIIVSGAHGHVWCCVPRFSSPWRSHESP
jgi:hypothetical protein